MSSFERVSVFTVCVLAVCALAFKAARAETVDRTVANVNGEIILYSEVQKEIKDIEKNTPIPELSDPAKRPEIERQVLEQMIRQKLADREVERLKVVVGNPEVDLGIRQFLEQHHATMEQLENNLKANGTTMEKFREQMKKQMERDRLLERVLKSKVVISDQQVDAYLKGEKGESTSTAQKFHLALIMLPVGDKSGKPEEVEKTGRDILEKIKGGADFKTLARQYSKGPAAQDGGDLGYLAAEELAPFIAQGIQNLKTGQVSGLVQGPGGYYILKVVDIDSKKVSKTDPALREKVRRTLYEQEVNRKFEEWVHNLESKAFIQISL